MKSARNNPVSASMPEEFHNPFSPTSNQLDINNPDEDMVNYNTPNYAILAEGEQILSTKSPVINIRQGNNEIKKQFENFISDNKTNPTVRYFGIK